MTAKQWIASVAMMAVLLTTTVSAHAGVIGTDQYLTTIERQSNLAAVSKVLMREDVQQHLINLGVSPEDALERVANLPDEDLAQMAEQMEELPAGGSLLAVVGLVFVVLLILDLTGVTNVFVKV